MFNSMFAWFNKRRVILKQVERNNSIVYGGQAIRQQIGFFARPSNDYDILSNAPKRSSHQLQNSLDKQAGGNHYYAQPSKFHKGTHKVYHVGKDGKRYTKDDIGIADFTMMPKKKPRTVRVEGINYIHINETMKDKRKALSSSKYKFRHKKDRSDLNRMKAFKRTIRGRFV